MHARSALATLLSLVLAGACAAPRPAGVGVDLRTELLGGYRAVSSDDIDALEGHGVMGLGFSTVERATGWGYEIGGSYGAEDGGGPRDINVEVSEFWLGIRKTWESPESNARPYVGAGAAYTLLDLKLRNPSFEDENEGAGAYVHGGVLWMLGTLNIDPGTSFQAGFDVRGVVGDDYDYAQAALVLAFGR